MALYSFIRQIHTTLYFFPLKDSPFGAFIEVFETHRAYTLLYSWSLNTNELLVYDNIIIQSPIGVNNSWILLVNYLLAPMLEFELVRTIYLQVQVNNPE